MRTTCERRHGILRGWPATTTTTTTTATNATATAATTTMVIAIAIVAAAVGVPSARAQQQPPPQPESQQPAAVKAAEEARAAIEAWDSADFYTRNGLHAKAAPFLEKFEQSRPVELWAAADYYIRKGQADKAVPYLNQLMKRRLDPATLLALRDQFGRDSFERLYVNPATRPFARLLNNALAAATAPPEAEAPGPELFAREPRTPIELWDAADYLMRTRQAKKAVPYLERFQQSKPDDAAFVAVRDRYGVGSFMRLNDDPTTRPFAAPLTEALTAAVRRFATRPDRIARMIAELTLTPAEQEYALRRLWEAGPFAVPPLLASLRRPGLAREDHALLLRNIGRLQPSAVPPLAAALESPDPAIAADAATALGSIGDRSAVPLLTFPAAAAASPAVRSAAQAAIERMTGRPFARQPKPPVRVLTDAAWSYHRERSQGPDEPIMLWSWDEGRKAPVPREVPPAEGRTALGLQFARRALRLDPTDRSAQVAQLSLALAMAAARVGPEAVATRDPATFAAATAAGPALLAQVLETAIADGQRDLAATAVAALARVTDRAALTTAQGRPHPLVRALDAPGRRTQLAAARAIVNLAPDRPFSGSSQVAKTLARFLVNQSMPRAVVIDGNPARAQLVASTLMSLGYLADAERTGRDGFAAAADSADVELILVAYDLHYGAWRLTDTLANLQADARTAGVPLFVYGPYDIRYTRPNLERDFPGIRYLVPSSDPPLLERQLGGRPTALSATERIGYAREAAALLARIAADRRGPMAAGLRDLEPALAAALRAPETAGPAVAALADVPDPSAQRSLLDVALDSTRPADLRAEAARRTVASIRRFGPLLTRYQESRLTAEMHEEVEPTVREGLAAIADALRPARPTAAAARTATPKPQPGAPR